MQNIIETLVIGAGLVLLDQVLRWCERRGWIYYTRRRARGVGVGGVMGELMNVFQPTRQVIVAEQEWQRVRVREAASGEDADPTETGRVERT